MWIRSELKRKARKSVRRNYFVTVLTTLILTIMLNAGVYYNQMMSRLQAVNENDVGAVSTTNTGTSGTADTKTTGPTDEETAGAPDAETSANTTDADDQTSEDVSESQASKTSGLGILSGLFSSRSKTLSDEYFDDESSETESESSAVTQSETMADQSTETAEDSETVFPGLTYEEAYSMEYGELMQKYFSYLKGIFSEIDWSKFAMFLGFWTIFQIFIGDIFQIGGCAFFMENADCKARPRKLFHGFQNGRYFRNMITLFLMHLKLFFWYMLLYIPGIVKSLEYRMVPYLLAEYPDMDCREAFQTSKEMMMGEKWKVFVLDLSFIPWIIADYFCSGLVSILWYRPYKYSTDAELYLKLKEQNDMDRSTDHSVESEAQFA